MFYIHFTLLFIIGLFPMSGTFCLESIYNNASQAVFVKLHMSSALVLYVWQ